MSTSSNTPAESNLVSPDVAIAEKPGSGFTADHHNSSETKTNTATFDFIDAYADYADILEAPREMHEAVAIQLMASTANKSGVTIPNGGVTLTFDLWILLLSGSGLGRSTLINLAAPIIKAANLDLQRDETWGSPQALYQEMSLHPNGLFMWGELSEKLKLLKDPRFSGAKEWITDRFDNLKIPDSVLYRATSKADLNTPPITFTSAPRINILATSSKDWFFSNLEQTDSTGGFMSRWIFLVAPKSGRVIPMPQRPDSERIGPLADRLKEISKLSGEVDLSEIRDAYDQWYRDTMKRFESQPDQDLALSYFNRLRGNILKLAAIYEMSSSASLRVSMEAWERAVQTAREFEETLFKLLPTGMNAEGFAITKMEERIRAKGDDGMTKSDFTRAYQHMDPRKRDQHLETLQKGERVVSFLNKPPKGRPAEYFVHEDYVKLHMQKYPDRKKRAYFGENS